MKIRTLQLIGGAIFAACVACGAEAATIAPKGVVLVNTGNGFVRINGPTEVKPGDMVMVNEGNAQVSYNSGSVANLQPGQVYTIGNEAAVGAEVGAAGAAGGIGGLSTTALVVGGLAIGGVAAAVIVATTTGASP